MENQARLEFLGSQVCLAARARKAFLVLTGKMVAAVSLACRDILVLQGHQERLVLMELLEFQAKMAQRELWANMEQMGKMGLLVNRVRTVKRDYREFLVCQVLKEMLARTVTVISGSLGSSQI